MSILKNTWNFNFDEHFRWTPEKKLAYSDRERKRDSENGKKLNNKYQHEITNHLNTAAYDTNGVISPTDLQYATNIHQTLVKESIRINKKS